MRKLVLLVATLGAALYLAPSAQAAFSCETTLDGFDRANSTDLGTNWTEVAPNPAIQGGQFTDLAPEPGLATYNGTVANGNEACADVFAGPAAAPTQYAAIDLRYGDLTNNVFIKLQDNNADGTFDIVYFYRGNNGVFWPTATSHALTPFTSARFHVVVNGSNVTADVDTNFDGIPEVSFTHGSLPTAGLGTKIGLGAFNGSKIDNFSIPKTEVPPGSAKLTCGGAPATRVGSDSGDVINGTAGPDVIVALGGTDLVRGRGGKDLICGGNGADKLVGGPGKDRLFGQKGKDQLVGGPKNDICAGGPGKDTSVAC